MKSILEYIRQLNRLKEIAIGRFGDLSLLERAIMDGSFDWLLDNLDIKRGVAQVTEDLTEAMNSFLGAVQQILRSNALFRGAIGGFLQDLDDISENNKAFHSTFHSFNPETAGVKEIQKAVVAEALEQFEGNGLNRGFTEPLRDGIYRNILAGASMKEVRQTMENHILSGKDSTGKLKQYLGQTAMMAVDTYTGAINQKLAQEFSFTGYVISGSLIATSSKQCVAAIELSEGGYLPFKEWEKILAMARLNKQAPLIAGTTLKNLPLNKLHWGCRHDFTPVIME